MKLILIGIPIFIIITIIDYILYTKSPFPERMTWWGYLPGGGIVTYMRLTNH